jgi:uncharacterized protein
MTVVRRILSIDGGGIMGVFPAAFLAIIEESTSKSIAEHFDMIVGTSTGGIIALALGLGIPARDILTFYEKMGPDVFAGNSFFKGLRHWLFAKHDQKKLRECLQGKFGDRLLEHSKTRLVIPSQKENGEIYLYKTAHHVDYRCDYLQSCVEVALATSAAPSYFATHHSSSGLALLDGGMWASNPAIVGVIEATTKLDWEPNSLRVLSLGCTTSPLELGMARWLPMGMLFWAKKSIDLFMAGQSSFSTGASRLIVGEDNFMRVSPVFPKDRFQLDGVKGIGQLKAWGDDEARKNLTNIHEMFLGATVEQFQPEYQSGQSKS